MDVFSWVEEMGLKESVALIEVPPVFAVFVMDTVVVAAALLMSVCRLEMDSVVLYRVVIKGRSNTSYRFAVH